MTVLSSVVQCFGPTILQRWVTIFSSVGIPTQREATSHLPTSISKLSPVTYSVLGVEDVGGRRVVDDDDFSELPAQSAEVFDVVSPVENAGFPEEPGAEHPPLVQQVGHRVGILRARNKNISSVSPQLRRPGGGDQPLPGWP